jgi:hypothetical protein
MAVILRRVGLTVLLVVAVLVPALRRDVKPTPSPLDPADVARLDTLAVQIINANVLQTALAQRESALVRVLDLGKAAGPLSLLVQGIPDSVRISAGEIEALWGTFTPDPTVRVGLLLYDVEGYRRSRRASYSGAFIKADGDGTDCITLLPIWGVRNNRVTLKASPYMQSLLAPCLLLSRFGRPGSPVDQWLVSTRYQAAGSASWLLKPREWIDGYEAPPWSRHYAPWWFDPSPLLRGFGARTVLEPRAPPYHLGAPVVRCLAGDTSECAAAVLDTTLLAAWGRATPRDLTAAFHRTQAPRAVFDAGPLAWWFLSDLIRDQGQDRFAKFWRSDEPMTVAFQNAFGLSLGDWSLRWARRQWEASMDSHYSKRFTLGVQMPPTLPLAALGWTVICLGLACWRASERTIG